MKFVKFVVELGNHVLNVNGLFFSVNARANSCFDVCGGVEALRYVLAVRLFLQNVSHLNGFVYCLSFHEELKHFLNYLLMNACALAGQLDVLLLITYSG